jgi:hypothetical protein
MKRVLISVLAIVCPMIFLPASGVLASSLTVKGLTVSPAIEQINLSKDQTTDTFNEQVTNNTSAPVLLTISVRDFTAADENGRIAFLSDSTTLDNAHGLESALKLSYSKIQLKVGGTQTIPVTITNINTLAQGGHYAAITYAINNPTVRSETNAITNNETLSSLVFLTTYGQQIQAIQLENVPWNSVIYSPPSILNLVLTNNGNTQTAPRGYVTITNTSGKKEFARGIINIDSGLVLPSTSRLYSVALRYENHFKSVGIYKLNIFYQADGASKFSVYTKNFIYISGSLIAGIVIFLLIIAILILRRFAPKVSYNLNRKKTKK